MPRDIMLERRDLFPLATAAAIAPDAQDVMLTRRDLFPLTARVPTVPTGTIADAKTVLEQLPGALRDQPRDTGAAIGRMLRRLTGKDDAPAIDTAIDNTETNQQLVASIEGRAPASALTSSPRPTPDAFKLQTILANAGVADRPTRTPEGFQTEAQKLGNDPTQAILDGKSPRINAMAEKITPEEVEAYRARIGTPEARAMPSDRLRRFMALEAGGQGGITSGAGTPSDQPGWASRNAADLGRGIVSAGIRQPAAAISSTIGAGLELAGSSKAATPFFDNAREVGARNLPGDTTGGFVGQTIGSIAPSGMALLLGPAGPSLVAAYYGTQGFGNGYQMAQNAAILQGRTPDPIESALVGMGTAASEAITEELGFEVVSKKLPSLGTLVTKFKANPTGAAAKALLDEIGQLSVAGAAEEGLSQVGQNVSMKGVDPNQRLTEGVGQAAAGGALGNLIMGGVPAARSALIAGVDAAQNRQNPQQPGDGSAGNSLKGNSNGEEKGNQEGRQGLLSPPGASETGRDAGGTNASPQTPPVAQADGTGQAGTVPEVPDDANLPQWAKDARQRMLERRGGGAAQDSSAPNGENAAAAGASGRVATQGGETRPGSEVGAEAETATPETPGVQIETAGAVGETNTPVRETPGAAPTEMESKSTMQLRNLARKRGVKAAGTREELLARLATPATAEEPKAAKDMAVGNLGESVGLEPKIANETGGNLREDGQAEAPAVTAALARSRAEGINLPEPPIAADGTPDFAGLERPDLVKYAKVYGVEAKGLKNAVAARVKAAWEQAQAGRREVTPEEFAANEAAVEARRGTPPAIDTSAPVVEQAAPQVAEMQAAPAQKTGDVGGVKSVVDPDSMSKTRVRAELSRRGIIDGPGDQVRERLKAVLAGNIDPAWKKDQGPEAMAAAARKAREDEERRYNEAIKRREELTKAIPSRPGWTLDYSSDSGSLYAKHNDSGEMIRLSDHVLPETIHRDPTKMPWKTDIVGRGGMPSVKHFEEAAKSIEDDWVETVAEREQQPIPHSAPIHTPSATKPLTSTQKKVREDLQSKSIMQLRNIAKAQGLYHLGDRDVLLERIVANTPEPKPAAGAYSKADVQRRLTDAIDRTGYPVDDVEDTGYLRQEALGEEQFTTSFGGPEPGEVRRYLDGRGVAHRKWFRFNVPGATGEDAMASLGEDRYFELVDQLISKSRNYAKAAKELAGMDPNIGFLAWLSDRLPADQASRKPFDVVRTETIAPGSTMTIAGTRFEAVSEPGTGDVQLVERNADGSEITERDPVLVYAAATEEVPVDAKSMKAPAKGKKTGASGLFGAIQEGAKQIADDAAARQEARARKRGTRLYSNPIPDPRDMADSILFITGRAVEMGIKGTREGAKALGKLVQSSLREVAPEHLPYAKDIRNQVARILRHKDATPENFERLVAEVAEPLRAGKPAKAVAKEKAAAPAKAAKGLTKRTAPHEAPTITESDALRTRLKAEERAAGRMGKVADSIEVKAAREIRKALQTAYKRGRADYARVADPIVQGLRAQIEAMPKRIEAAMDLARRGGKDEAKAAQAVKDGIRDQMLDLAKDYPAKVRGKLNAAIARADTPTKMVRILDKLDRQAYRDRVGDSAKKIVRATSPKKLAGIKGITEDLRQKAKAIRDLARAYHAESRMKEVTTGRLKVLAEELDAKADELALEVTIARNQFADIKGLRGMNAMAVAHTTVRTIEARREVIKTAEAKDPEPGWFTTFRQRWWNLSRALAHIEGKTGPLRTLVYGRGVEVERHEATLNRDALAKADEVARKAGFKDFKDAEARLDWRSGRGVGERIQVQIDGKMETLTLGEALDLYGHATDPNTARQFVNREKPVTTERGKDSVRLHPSMNDALALKLALEAHQPGITTWVDNHRAVRDPLWDLLKTVVYRLTGKEPLKLVNHWRRDTYVEPEAGDNKAGKAAASALDMTNAASFVGGLLENSGWTKERVDNKNPILLRNPATKLREEIASSAKIVAKAEWVRDVLNVVSEKTLLATAAKRMRPGLMKLVRDQIAMTYQDAEIQRSGLARLSSLVSRNLSVAFLGLNAKAYAVNAAGIVRMLPDIRAEDLVAAHADAVANGRSLYRDLAKRDAFFWDRYNRPVAERVTGANTADPSRPEGHLVRQLVRAARNAKAALTQADGERGDRIRDFIQAFDNTEAATHVVMEAYQKAELPAIVTVYAAKIRESRATHAGWSEDQHRDWAAIETEKQVRETMPGHSNLDGSFRSTAARARGTSMFYTFMGDTLRVKNRIGEALATDPKRAAKVMASEAVSIVTTNALRVYIGKVIATAIAAAFGWDPEDWERIWGKGGDLRQIAVRSAGDLVSLGNPWIGGILKAGGQISGVAPPSWEESQRALEGVRRTVETTAEAIAGDEKARARLWKVWSETGIDVGAVALGNPLTPYLRQIVRESERQTQPEAINLLDEDAKELRAKARSLERELERLSAEAKASGNYKRRDAFLTANREFLIFAVSIESERRQIRLDLANAAKAKSQADRTRMLDQATRRARMARVKIKNATQTAKARQPS
mgnify:CR=1 FL=1